MTPALNARLSRIKGAHPPAAPAAPAVPPVPPPPPVWRYWTQRTGTRWAIVRQSDQGGSPIVECDCPSEALAAGAMADCKARFVKGGGLVAAEA